MPSRVEEKSPAWTYLQQRPRRDSPGQPSRSLLRNVLESPIFVEVIDVRVNILVAEIAAADILGYWPAKKDEAASLTAVETNTAIAWKHSTCSPAYGTFSPIRSYGHRPTCCRSSDLLDGRMGTKPIVSSHRRAPGDWMFQFGHLFRISVSCP